MEDLREFENKLYKEGYQFIGGVDEVGRGPLVGPVVAACCVLPKDFVLEGLTDSKKLSEKKRDLFAAYIKEHIGITIHMFIITILQRFAMFMVTYFVYRAFELSGTDALTIVMLQAVISICVDMLPLPGGMGISEILFKGFYAVIFGAKLLPGLVLSRGLGYYSELIMSAILTIVAMFVIKEE